jgi:hypothetical protein
LPEKNSAEDRFWNIFTLKLAFSGQLAIIAVHHQVNFGFSKHLYTANALDRKWSLEKEKSVH